MTEKKHFSDIHNKVMNLNHFDEFEGENYDDFENQTMQSEFFENVERYVQKGASRSAAERQSYNAMKNKYGAPKAAKVMAAQPRTAMRGLSNGLQTSAVFVLTITRNSGNIETTLPVPIFARIHKEDDYRAFVNQYIPSGVLLSVSNVNGSILLTYTNGVLTDTISISCSSVAYLTLLEATIVNMFRINRIRYTLGNSANVTQFDQSFDIVSKSMYGLASTNQVPVATFRDPKNFQSGIIDLPVTADIDLETGIVLQMIPVAQSLTLGVNVQTFNNRTRAKL